MAAAQDYEDITTSILAIDSPVQPLASATDLPALTTDRRQRSEWVKGCFGCREGGGCVSCCHVGTQPAWAGRPI